MPPFLQPEMFYKDPDGWVCRVCSSVDAPEFLTSRAILLHEQEETHTKLAHTEKIWEYNPDGATWDLSALRPSKKGSKSKAVDHRKNVDHAPNKVLYWLQLNDTILRGETGRMEPFYEDNYNTHASSKTVHEWGADADDWVEHAVDWGADTGGWGADTGGWGADTGGWGSTLQPEPVKRQQWGRVPRRQQPFQPQPEPAKHQPRGRRPKKNVRLPVVDQIDQIGPIIPQAPKERAQRMQLFKDLSTDEKVARLQCLARSFQ